MSDKHDNWELVEAGNDLPTTVDLASLTYTEIKILLKMLDPEFIEMTIIEKCEHIGCARWTYYRALKKPAFIEAMNQIAMSYVKENSVKLMRATVKYALAGSFQHMKLALEAGGIVQPAAEIGEVKISFVDPRAKAIDITAGDEN